MTKKTYIILFLIFTLTGCNHNNVKKDKTKLVSASIVCVHKYDPDRIIKYNKPQSILHKIDTRLSIYEITDINNKRWYINNFEMVNYNCNIRGNK